MKTERDKAFEKYVMSLRRFKTRDPMYIFALDENGDYDLQDVYDLHHAWIASASREGYKLVPVELTNDQAVKISDDPEFFETYQTILNNSDTSEDSVSVLLRVAHKAMIGEIK